MSVAGPTLQTERLLLRPWLPDDAQAALALYGDPALVRRLSPALTAVPDVGAMRLVLEQWILEHGRLAPPAGRWAIQARDDGRLVGGIVLLPLPPGDEDSEIGYQLLPAERGRGLATEAAGALVRWAFRQGLPEVFVVSRPSNHAGSAVATRLGFQWVGETSKYYGLRLQVHRLRPADLEP